MCSFEVTACRRCRLNDRQGNTETSPRFNGSLAAYGRTNEAVWKGGVGQNPGRCDRENSHRRRAPSAQSLTPSKFGNLGFIATAGHGAPAPLACTRGIEKEKRAAFAVALTYSLRPLVPQEDYCLASDRERRAAAFPARRATADNLERILRAAHEFMASGFTGATTAAIARNAEVTEAQLFRYFSSKIELFHESVFKPLNQHFLDFTSSQRSDDSPAETRRDKSHRNINELQEFLNLHSKSLMSLAVAQTYLPGSMNGIHDIDSLNTYFERGATMMASRILGIPKVDPTLMVRVSFAAVLGSILFKDWIFPQGLASDPEISAAIKAFVMDGINANAASECQPSKAITAGRSMSNANHQLARSFFDALSKGDVPDDLLTPDMTFWSTSSGAWSDRARFQYGIKLLASIFSGGLTYVVDSLTAEEDRVAAEVQSCGTLINGKEYQGRYVFVLRLRDQRIASVAEHNDPGSVRGRLGALLQTAIEKKQ